MDQEKITKNTGNQTAIDERNLRKLREMILLYFIEDGACIEEFLKQSEPHPKLWAFISSLPSLGLSFVQIVRETLGFTPPRTLPRDAKEIFAYVQELLAEQSWEQAVEWIAKGLELVGADYAVPLIEKYYGNQPQRQAEALFVSLSVHLIGHVSLELLAPQLSRNKTNTSSARGPSKIILVGGIGSLEDQYAAICAAKGWELIHIEKDVKKIRRRKHADNSSVVAILIITGINSHPLEEAAKEVAERQRIPVFYSRSRGSVSSVREMMEAVSTTLSK